MAYFPNSRYDSDASSSSSSASSPTLDNCLVMPGSPTLYTAESGTDDVFRDVVKCRKSWKTLKGGKVVWPLHLEKALLEGLALYKPDNSRETLLLGRFPMRNRFISEHILRTTGEKRSAKQVGSRLQQLRDTCGGGGKLQRLLSPCLDSGASISLRSRNTLSHHGSRSAMCNTSLASAPASPASDERELPWNLPTVFYINIEADSNVARECSTEQDYLNSVDATIGSSPEPRPIKAIKPSLAFVSTLWLFLNSEFVIHGLSWRRDPTEFTIQHNIIRYSSESPDMSAPLFSATYKFRYMPEKARSTTVNSGISAFQEIDAANIREYNGLGCFNTGDISEFSSGYDNKNWQNCFDTLSLTEQRGYSSLPATPRCQWDEYSSPSIGDSSSSSSSPTTSTFPPHSPFYPSHQV
ncbi:hypothetical protein BT96DRAFT_987088 [Gymnopus androsaceus JB14]|uniref:TEA domain-containing protein n=1 Tax=Gymnopus androsaceus JB14 TaxID=1447944 RepID=A0A6A4I7Z7_9AGAR|nr:hypothetical protein BT96DRAFT_987088 [Gymnopus androsaceus JB14]